MASQLPHCGWQALCFAAALLACLCSCDAVARGGGNGEWLCPLSVGELRPCGVHAAGAPRGSS